MNSPLLNITRLAALSILTSATVLAQKNSPVQLSNIHQFRNSDASVGSVSVDRFDIRGGVPLINNEDKLLAIGFRYAQDRYNFNNTTANWKTIHHGNLGLASRWKVNDSWLWANYLVGGIAAEEGSDKGDGFVFNYISIAEYKVNDRLTIGPGFGISNEIDRDVNIFPILAIEWKINDELFLGSGPSEVSVAGANVYLEYTPKALDNKWIFTAGASYSSNTFKLADNTTTADGSGSERLGSVYLAAGYKVRKNVKVSAILGYHLFQSYSIYDSSGNELSKEKLERAPYVGIALGYEF